MNDYIRREDVLKAIDYQHEVNNVFESEASYVQMWETINDDMEIKAANVQPIDRWISVDDRLPNIGERVFVYIPRPDNHYNTEIAYISEGNDDYPYWVLGDKSQFYSTRFHYISQWQPLPEPPKDGDTK